MRAFVGVFGILLAALLVGGAGFGGTFFGWWGAPEPVGEIALSPRPAAVTRARSAAQASAAAAENADTCLETASARASSSPIFVDRPR